MRRVPFDSAKCIHFDGGSAETAVRCRSGHIGRSGASPAAERSLPSQYSLLLQWLALSSPHRDQTSLLAAQMVTDDSGGGETRLPVGASWWLMLVMLIGSGHGLLLGAVQIWPQHHLRDRSHAHRREAS